MIASTSGIVPSAARALRNFTAWKKNRGKRKCSRAFQSITDKQYMQSFFSSQRRVLALLFFVFSHLSEKEMIWFARCAIRCSSPLHSATLLDFIQLILRLINVRGHRFSFEFCKLFTKSQNFKCRTDRAHFTWESKSQNQSNYYERPIRTKKTSQETNENSRKN